jgi:hypothetical protein
MVASPKGLGPKKDCAGKSQQHIQKTDPSSSQRGRLTKKKKTVTVKESKFGLHFTTVKLRHIYITSRVLSEVCDCTVASCSTLYSLLSLFSLIVEISESERTSQLSLLNISSDVTENKDARSSCKLWNLIFIERVLSFWIWCHLAWFKFIDVSMNRIAFLHSVDGGSIFLRNITELIPDYTASYLRR